MSTRTPTSPERPSALPLRRKPTTAALPRCVVLASSDRSRRLLGMLVLHATERIELITMDWPELGEGLGARSAVLLADVETSEHLDAVRQLRGERPDLQVAVIVATDLEARARATEQAEFLLTRPLHASLVVATMRRALTANRSAMGDLARADPP